jgi:hypothetical protein
MTEAPQLAHATDDTARDQRCAVCEHDLADHDSISHRYCQATQAHALSRDCICPDSHNVTQAGGRLHQGARQAFRRLRDD